MKNYTFKLTTAIISHYLWDAVIISTGLSLSKKTATFIYSARLSTPIYSAMPNLILLSLFARIFNFVKK